LAHMHSAVVATLKSTRRGEKKIELSGRKDVASTSGDTVTIAEEGGKLGKKSEGIE